MAIETKQQDTETRDNSRDVAFFALHGIPVNNGINKDMFVSGYNAGYERGRTKTTIELVNEFHGNGYPHSWFAPVNWHRRTLRLRTFLNRMWDWYGPAYEDED